MTINGDSETDGSLRIEGTIRGSVRAGKSVVVGRDGLVDGSIYTQDAVISGRVSGGIHAVSRLELLATSEVSGEIEAPRMQVEEGAKVHGQVTVGEAVEEGASQVEQPQTLDGGGKAEPEPPSEALGEVAPEDGSGGAGSGGAGSGTAGKFAGLKWDGPNRLLIHRRGQLPKLRCDNELHRV